MGQSSDGRSIPNPPKVVIVVLNWNSGAETLVCLHSLTRLRFSNYSVLVVDNASTDDSVTRIRSAYPGVAIIEAAANLGYSGGNNLGIMYALRQRADLVLVLNNDAVLEPESVTRSVEVVEMLGEKAGVVGFATYHYDKPDVLQCLGLNSGLEDGYYVPSVEELARSVFLPISSSYGCAMLVTRRLIETVGLFDDDFFLEHEERDLCARARRAGLAVVGATQARAWHKGSVSFGGAESTVRLYYLLRNWPLYAKKRFTELNEHERFPEYMKQYRIAMVERAMEYLRDGRLPHAFAVLAAARCAEARRWGRKQISVGLRLRVIADIISLLGRAAGRRVGRLLLGRQGR